MDLPICNKRKRGAAKKTLKSLQYQPSDLVSDEEETNDEENGIEEEITQPNKRIRNNIPTTSSDVPTTSSNKSTSSLSNSENICKKCNMPLKKKKY